MAQFAVSAVGAAVGFAIGGPVGAQVGWVAGSIGGSLLFAPDQEGPHVSDMKLPQWQYGTKLYRLYGSNRVTPAVGWFSEKRELSTTTSAKGGPEVTTHSAEIDILYILSIDSDVVAVTRIWRNGELIWSQHSSSDSTSLSNSTTTDAWTDMRFLDGNPAQLPDPTIEAADGVGNVSAYRHRQCVMIEGLQLGQSGQLPLMEFECITKGTLETFDTRLLMNFERDVLDETDYSHDITAVGGSATLGGGALAFDAAGGSDCYAMSGPYATLGLGSTFTVQCYATIFSPQPKRFPTIFELADIGGNYYVFVRFDREGHAGQWELNYNANSSGFFEYSTGTWPAGKYHVCVMQSGDGIALWVNGERVTNYIANVGAFSGDLQIMLGNQFSGTNDPTDESAYTGSISSFKATYGAKLFADSFTPPPEPLLLDGNQYTPGTEDLADVVSDELSRGIDTSDFDVTALEGIPVRGFKTTGAVRPGVEQLMPTFDFGFVCSDKLYARLLGGASVVTIPFADLAANEDQATDTPFDPVRANDGEIPQKFLLTYPNYSDDYNNGTEEGARGSGEGQATGEVAVVMTPTEAKQVAQKRAAIAGIEATTAQISITDYYARVEPTDPITVTDEDDTLYRMRVLKETYGGGVKQLELVRDDVQVLVAPGTTSTDYSASFTVATPADTEIVLVDSAILRDADNDPGFYAFAKGSRRGSALFASPSDVTYTQVATFTDEATFGDCTTTLGDWTGGRKFDETNSVTVDVGSGTLSSSTRAAMLLDQSVNLAAVGVDGRWEVIQFRTATLQSEGIYKLTGLLRGGRGTEWASTGHTADEKVVLLTTAGRRVPMDSSQLGISNYYKGVTVGRLISSADAEAFTDNGIGQKPFAPTKVRIARDSSGNATFTWGRRSRLSSRFGGSLGSYTPLGETSESYTVRIYTDNTYATVVRSISATSETASYSASDQTTDFGSAQSTLYFDVVQNGALTGYATQKAA